MTTIRYTVPGISCQHCVNAISAEVGSVAGVSGVEVSLDHKTVTVTGDAAAGAIAAAIDEAGYEVDGDPAVVDDMQGASHDAMVGSDAPR